MINCKEPSSLALKNICSFSELNHVWLDSSPISMDEQVLATLSTFRVLESLEKKEPVEINLSEVLQK